MVKVSNRDIYGKPATLPGGHVFQRLKVVLDIFVEGHL